jgi:chromosome segregation ATPase
MSKDTRIAICNICGIAYDTEKGCCEPEYKKLWDKAEEVRKKIHEIDTKPTTIKEFESIFMLYAEQLLYTNKSITSCEKHYKGIVEDWNELDSDCMLLHDKNKALKKENDQLKTIKANLLKRIELLEKQNRDKDKKITKIIDNVALTFLRTVSMGLTPDYCSGWNECKEYILKSIYKMLNVGKPQEK